MNTIEIVDLGYDWSIVGWWMIPAAVAVVVAIVLGVVSLFSATPERRETLLEVAGGFVVAALIAGVAGFIGGNINATAQYSTLQDQQILDALRAEGYTVSSVTDGIITGDAGDTIGLGSISLLEGNTWQVIDGGLVKK